MAAPTICSTNSNIFRQGSAQAFMPVSLATSPAPSHSSHSAAEDSAPAPRPKRSPIRIPEAADRATFPEGVVIALLFLLGFFSPFLEVTVVAHAFVGMLAWRDPLATPPALLICFTHPDLPSPPPLTLPRKIEPQISWLSHFSCRACASPLTLAQKNQQIELSPARDGALQRYFSKSRYSRCPIAPR